MTDSGKRSSFTDDEAKARFEKTRRNDPFPDIAPALLNSADIHEYIEATGMISPYYPDFVKSASYEAHIGDDAVYWDEKGERYPVDLSTVESITIQPNSLIYLTTEQIFRLPDYIAVRFNLRITNVHRGLLLGTGPLVDPGFEGQLVIPLHNFTTNEYKFKGGERFIWVEFTKISPNNRWMPREKRSLDRSRDYKVFPKEKKYKSIDYYLKEASPHHPIMNAIPAALAEAEGRAKKAERMVEQVRNWGFGALFLAVLTGGLTILFGLLPIFNDFSDLAVDTTALITDAKSEVQQSQHKTDVLEQRLLDLDKKIESLQQQLDGENGSAPANPDQK